MKIIKGGNVSTLLKPVELPKMFRAEQSFPNNKISPEEIPSLVFSELSKEPFIAMLKPGMSIAITAGSRGIRNVDIITKAIVDFVKSCGAFPFIVPAMGSHGGATAEGQLEVLAGYNITEKSMGCEIRSSMDIVDLGYSEMGRRVVIDKHAYNADGIIVSCRLKPHNAFRGEYESGPCKMMSVGLGKQQGAEQVHSDGMNIIHQNIPAMAKVILEKAPILFAVPCIENAYDETFHIEAIPANEILNREPELLKLAFANMPKILVEHSDVLVVKEIGKNFSGTGVDPNVTGTFSTPYASGGLGVQRTCFLNLSEESHGNALGVGLASAITKKIFDEIDIEKMYPNCITSTVLASARIPCVVATDKEAIQICIRTATGVDKQNIKMVAIENSLHIGSVMLSQAYYKDVIRGKYDGLTATSDLFDLAFDANDNLITEVFI